MLLLPERQKGDVWEPSKKQCSFDNRGSTDRKVLPLFFSPGVLSVKQVTETVFDNKKTNI
jgi:hypothetical protein